jgi:hypothetical protein
LEDEDNIYSQSFTNDMYESLPMTGDDHDNSDYQAQNCRNIVQIKPDDTDTSTAHVQQVSICSSPFINAFVNNHSVKITLDTGATVNLINETLAILPTSSDLPFKPESKASRWDH